MNTNKDEIEAPDREHTVDRHSQEEGVGDVHHDAAQHTQHVHLTQAVPGCSSAGVVRPQAVQVVLGGGGAHVHRLQHPRTGQS